MDTTQKKVVGALAAISGISALAYIFSQKKPSPPPIDPAKAVLFGTVSDSNTLTGISNINVDCEGYRGESDSEGAYSIVNIPPGDYTVTITDPVGEYLQASRTVKFEAGDQIRLDIQLTAEDIGAKYYSPYGGTRMPLCTDILIPNVPAFDHSGEGWPAWAGGDMVWSEYFGPDFYYIAPISEFRPAQCLIEIAEQLPQGQPIAWTPSDAVVANWVTNYSTGRGIPIPRLLVAATEYTCPEYWHTKHELAAMIAGRETMIYAASEWTYIYGKTCPTCGGTGQVVCTPGMHGCRPGQMTTCSTCGGDGIIVIVDLTRGIRDWIKPFDYYVWYYGYTYTTRIRCPVCDTVFQAGLYDSDPGQAGREDAAFFLLNHIESSHPTHPLTEPAWF